MTATDATDPFLPPSPNGAAGLELPPSHFRVYLEPDAERPGDYVVLDVHADQRDMRRARLQTRIPDGDIMGELIAMTWAAARRCRLTELSWSQWEITCAWVIPDPAAPPDRPTVTAGD